MSFPTVFFCYAWGSDERYEKLEFLREEILKKSNSRIQVILDKHSYEDNQDFNELRERIRVYDLVLVFCTPDMKQIVKDPDANKNKDREVLKELKIIEERFNDDPSSVYPVIFENDKKKSLLDFFEGRKSSEFKEFNVYKNKKQKYSVPDKKKEEFNIFVGKIINTALYNRRNRSAEYASTREALNKLFTLTDTTEIPYSCLVKPDIYNQILNQTCYLVAGRKGSGKSTLINNLDKMDSEYFKSKYMHMIPLHSEFFQHENAYSILIENHKEDLNIITLYDRLCLFWQVYFLLHCIVTIGIDIEEYNIRPDDKRFKIFDACTKKLKKKIGLKPTKSYESFKGDTVPKNVFLAAVELIDEQFQVAMNSINDSQLLVPSFSSVFNLQKIAERLFGKTNCKNLVEALQISEKKIFIALDGFDTHSEDFRRTTEAIADEQEQRRRTDYEILFFRTLIEVVSYFKEHNYADPVPAVISSKVDFCIVLPKDRCDQIVEIDRDSFKRHFGSMSWTAYELMKMLTKRLEYLISKITKVEMYPSSPDYYERMNNALNFFPGLPKSISMNIQGSTVSMSLFNYILRSSFWRPRDVISNLSALISQIVIIDEEEEIYKLIRDIKLSEEEVKLAIKDNSGKILEEEFYDEYKHVFRNLRSVLDQFRSFEEQSDIHTFISKLSTIQFDDFYSYDTQLIENKLRVLYQLGVIGLLYDNKTVADMHYLHGICFVFNAGMTPFNDFVQHDLRTGSTAVKIIFNPIFARALRLNFDNTKHLLGNWTDEYIKENYKMKRAIRLL